MGQQRQAMKWSQHNTGFGMKMLKMMGWSGKGGLGKEEIGIAAPVQTKVRGKEGLI